ncbi:MAG: NPCBM/NEW2 domain-containing protein [Candidatus Sumerlaeia bacterium]|nr:NPCBM/NEW2 domain-containing protein [Candidatus Sumerlaeia bacterium]
MAITDSRTGRRWVGGHTGDSYRDAYFVELREVDDSSLIVVLQHPRRDILFDCTITISEAATVTFDVVCRSPDEELDFFHFPPRMETELADGALLFADRSPGILLPQHVTHYENQILQTYGNVGALDLPWIGVLDRTDGDGLMIHFDTPENSGAFINSSDQGHVWPRVAWFPSMATFEYPRRASFIFTEGGGHVSMAKLYREMAKEKGKILPLAERAAERPWVEWLLGAPYIWGRSTEDFVHQLRTHGIRRGVIKGRSSTDQMTVMKELGYLTSEYDSYTDIQEGEPGPQTDNIEETALRLRDGSPMRGWQTHHGIQYYTRSHYFARSRAELYVPPILENHPFTARFIDVSAAIQPFEDWAPDRRFGARQDLDYRRDLFRYFTDELRLVLGAEHAKGWTMPLIDYSEGNMSSSFWWESERPGQLLPFLSTDEMSENYLEIGMNMEWRVPLWDLVFHDVVVSTWYWGDSNGYLYNVLPEYSDLKDALNILHGTPPMMWANHLGYGWDRNRDRFVETYRVTGRWHEVVGFDELLDHAYLSEDRLVQRTTFSSGATAHVNLDDSPRTVEIDGESWTLAPYGFHAAGNGISQWRIERDGIRETVVMADRYISLEKEQETSFGPFEGSGLIDLFEVTDGRWHLLTRGHWNINPAEVVDLDTSVPYALVRIDEGGGLVEELTRISPGASFSLPAADSVQLYALLPEIDEHTPLLFPQGGRLAPDQTISISASPDATVRYTLDGSEITADSPVYTEPIRPTESVTLRARAFDGATPISKPVTGSFTPSRVLFRSDIRNTNDDPLRVSLDVTGARTIRILIDDADDGLDFDSAAIGEARFITPNGDAVPLKNLEVIRYSESDSRDHSIDADDITIGGRAMESAVRTHAFADFIFALDRRFETFEAWLGIPDDTEGMGSIRFAIQAEY